LKSSLGKAAHEDNWETTEDADPAHGADGKGKRMSIDRVKDMVAFICSFKK